MSPYERLLEEEEEDEDEEDEDEELLEPQLPPPMLPPLCAAAVAPPATSNAATRSSTCLPERPKRQDLITPASRHHRVRGSIPGVFLVRPRASFDVVRHVFREK